LAVGAVKFLLLGKTMNLKNIPQKLFLYLKEVRTEMKKVNWPTRQEILRYTLIVIGISVGVAIFLGGVDFAFTTILEKFVF